MNQANPPWTGRCRPTTRRSACSRSKPDSDSEDPFSAKRSSHRARHTTASTLIANTAPGNNVSAYLPMPRSRNKHVARFLPTKFREVRSRTATQNHATTESNPHRALSAQSRVVTRLPTSCSRARASRAGL